MQSIYKIFSDPAWWFGVFIVGIIINLLSSYIKSPLDKFLSSISSKWEERVLKREAILDRWGEVYADNIPKLLALTAKISYLESKLNNSTLLFIFFVLYLRTSDTLKHNIYLMMFANIAIPLYYVFYIWASFKIESDLKIIKNAGYYITKQRLDVKLEEETKIKEQTKLSIEP